MKNTFFALIALVLMSTSAFAIDQVTLTNGEVLEGKVLSDVPNRHVDIQLINGNKRRIQRTEITNVERDVPSNKDTSIFGNESRVYFGLNAGGYKNMSSSTSDVLFNYGARFGANMMQMGDFAKLAFGLSYNRSSQTLLGLTSAVNEVMVQILFRKVANSGFYFGPEFGLVFVNTSIAGQSSTSNKFDFGGVGGYDYYLSPSFSMGPEVHITAFNSDIFTKFLLGATFHFN